MDRKMGNLEITKINVKIPPPNNTGLLARASVWLADAIGLHELCIALSKRGLIISYPMYGMHEGKPKLYHGIVDADLRKHVADQIIATWLNKCVKFTKEAHLYDGAHDERTHYRLAVLEVLGFEYNCDGSFYIPGKMSGFYLERVWDYNEPDFYAYIKWATSVKGETK